MIDTGRIDAAARGRGQTSAKNAQRVTLNIEDSWNPITSAPTRDGAVYRINAHHGGTLARSITRMGKIVPN